MASTVSTKNKRKNFNPRFNLNLADDLVVANESSSEQRLINTNISNSIMKIKNINSKQMNNHDTIRNYGCNINPRKNFKSRRRRYEKILKTKENEIKDAPQSSDVNIIYQIPNTNFTITSVPNCSELHHPSESFHIDNFIKNIEQINKNTDQLPKNTDNYNKNIENVSNVVRSTESFSGFSAGTSPLEYRGIQASTKSSSIRDFAVKTVQELLNIYGMSISTKEVSEALNMHLGKSPEPPTPPSTPKFQTVVSENDLLLSRSSNTDIVISNNSPSCEPTTSSMVGLGLDSLHKSQPSNLKVGPNIPSSLIGISGSNSLKAKYKNYNITSYDQNISDKCLRQVDLQNNSDVSVPYSKLTDVDTDNEFTYKVEMDSDSESEKESRAYEKNFKCNESFNEVFNLRCSSNLFDEKGKKIVQNSNKIDNMNALTTTEFDESINSSSFSDNMGCLSSMTSQFALSDSNEKSNKAADYSRHLTKYSSHLECQILQCRAENIREHFHCGHSDTCALLPLTKKEQITRHLKWHQKRSDSLNHGFLRFSSTDDCSTQFDNCSHNKKQTHYHCLQKNCDKVYISTSDVQMHSNYHRKDTAIIQEGFQRYRATEECSADYCIFFQQRTTHFHCRRTNCQFTFKNKADMEKHKSYHIKDEQLSKDGFKKILKTEHCNFDNCKFSKICNHIHCIRENCNYVLHSSGQLFSHKRKHERKDNEQNYRKFKIETKCDPKSVISGNSDNDNIYPVSVNSVDISAFEKSVLSIELNPKDLLSYSKSLLPTATEISVLPTDLSSRASVSNDNMHSKSLVEDMFYQKAMLPTDLSVCNKSMPSDYDEMYSAPQKCLPEVNKNTGFASIEVGFKDMAENNESNEINLEENIPKNFISCLSKGILKVGNLDEIYKQYFSDRCTSNIEVMLGQQVIQHSRDDEHKLSNFKNIAKKRSTEIIQCSVDHNIKHVHCIIENCLVEKACQIIPDITEDIINHLKVHFHLDYENNTPYIDRIINDKIDPDNLTASDNIIENSENVVENSENMDHINSIDRFFNRKRGRPPKNRFVEVYNSTQNSPQAIFTSFKLEKTSAAVDNVTVDNSLLENTMEEDELDRTSVVRSSGIFFPQKSEKNTVLLPTEACRPFCKLKKKLHYHCDICNQAFTDQNKLHLHQIRHPNISTPNLDSKLLHVPQDDKSLLLKKSLSCDLRRQSLDRSLESPIEKHSQVQNPQTIKEENIGEPENLSIKTLPYSESSVTQNLDFDQNLANFLIYQRNQFYFQNYYHQLLNQQLIIQNQNFVENPIQMENHASTIEPQNYENLKRSLSDTQGGLEFGKSVKKNKSGEQSKSNVSEFSRHITNFVMDCSPKMEYPTITNEQLTKVDQKMQPVQTYSDQTVPKNRIFKDEPVPKGYLKFKFNEDCNFQNCGYRNHQSHFHCIRTDCCYSFCDKTRFVQHSARHERLDKLMGGDFKQYRANMNCGYADCEYSKNLGSNNKSSHFHCSSCSFICSDTNKVVAHRRQHTKLNQIKNAGFEKFAPSMSCTRLGISPTSQGTRSDTVCIHNLKQTHYHCLVCNYAVLGLAQMSAHKFRHME